MLLVADYSGKVLELPWWALLLLALVAYRAFNTLTYYVAYKKSGATLAPAVSDGWYGFKLMRVVVEKQKKGEMPDYLYSRFIETGKDTVRLVMAGTPVVSTRDPKHQGALGHPVQRFHLGAPSQAVPNLAW